MQASTVSAKHKIRVNHLSFFIPDPFADNFDKDFGISSNGVFYVRGTFNHDKARTVCKAFGARLATKEEIGTSASNDGRGFCRR